MFEKSDNETGQILRINENTDEATRLLINDDYSSSSSINHLSDPEKISKKPETMLVDYK